MIDSKIQKVNAYAIFVSSDKWYWKWMKEGFQHVAVCYTFPNGTVVIDPFTSHIGVSMYDTHDLSEIFPESSTIVPVSSKIDPEYIYSRMSFGTCVDTAKRLLGIKKLWIFTPYQLYRYLHDRQ